VEDFAGDADGERSERRSLPRITPSAKIWAAVDNLTRNEMLGMAEVSDFSGLGIALCNMPGDPVAARGDNLRVTLIAEEGIIPLSAKLIYVNRRGVMGLRIEPPTAAGQHFLLRLYERAATLAA
jgi:hypothetical protein